MERRTKKFERDERGMKLVWLRRKWGSTFRCFPSPNAPLFIPSILRSDLFGASQTNPAAASTSQNVAAPTSLFLLFFLVCVQLSPCFSFFFFFYFQQPKKCIAHIQTKPMSSINSQMVLVMIIWRGARKMKMIYIIISTTFKMKSINLAPIWYFVKTLK